MSQWNDPSSGSSGLPIYPTATLITVCPLMPSLGLFSRPVKNSSHYFLNTSQCCGSSRQHKLLSHQSVPQLLHSVCACSDVALLLKRPLMWNKYRKQGQWDVWAKEANTVQDCGCTNWIHDSWLFLCSLFLSAKQLPITWLLPSWITPTQRRLFLSSQRSEQSEH